MEPNNLCWGRLWEVLSETHPDDSKESSNVWFPPCSKPLLRACSFLLDHDILFLSSEKRLDPPQGLPSPLSSPHRPTILVSLVTSTTTSVAIKFPNQPPILPGVRWPSKLGSAALAPTLLLNHKHLKHQFCKWPNINLTNGQFLTLQMAKYQMNEAVKTLHGRLFSSQFVRCFLWRRTTPPGNGSVPEHPKDSRLFQSRKKEGVALPLFVSKPQRLTAGDEDGGWCRPVCAKQDYLFSSMFGG